MDKDCKDIDVKPRLWSLVFTVKGEGKGCAVVKALDSKNAINVLKSEGFYNGTSYLYEVESVEEIIESPDTMLVSEQVLKTNE